MQVFSTHPFTPPQQKIVLNVDDNDLNQLVIAKILEKAGFKTVSAYNGAMAIQLLNEGLTPDSILMDLQMPVMNGIDASAEIRKLNPAIPIIINSGLVTTEEKIRLSEIGIYDYLEKPYTQKDIIAKLLKNLDTVSVLKD
jgi:CheY-like chemotaxis protein